MRLLGLGLLVILLFALARFALLQPDVQSLVGLNAQNDRVEYNLVSNRPADTVSEGEAPNRHSFLVRESDTWTALTGSPGFASASFNMPKEVAVISGELVMDVTAELQAGSVARMRVNVNGERRGEVILSEGANAKTIRVNLLPSDLTQSQLVVNLGAFGSFPNQACRRDWDGGMIVRVEPTSRVELVTEEPLSALTDRLRATGNPYRIVWPDAPGELEYERLLGFAIDQSFRDIRTVFTAPGHDLSAQSVAFSAADMNAAAEIFENSTRAPDDLSWPVPIAQENGNTEARFFEYETTWRHAYDLRQTPNAEYPKALSFGLSALGLQDDAEWLVAVTLNGVKVYSEKFTGASLELNQTVQLPVDLHDFSNVLEVKLVSSERQNQDQCTRGSPITAQLKPSTVLVGGVTAEDVSIGQFINALNGPLHLKVSETLNAAEASTAVPFLSEAFGDRVQWIMDQEGGGEDSHVILSPRSELQDRFEQARRDLIDHIFWLISPRLFDRGDLPYRQTELTDQSLKDFEQGEGPRIAAIVAIKRKELPPVEPATAVQEEAVPALPGEGPSARPETEPADATDSAPADVE